MEKPYVVGIDIGGTNTVFGIVDARGTILASGSIKTGAYDEADNYVDEVCKNLLPLIIANGGVDKIKGIGIGAPNGNYYSGTIEFAPNLPWKGVIPLAAMFEERLGIPTALTNDANAAAIGEMTYGAARGMKDFIMITLGTGVGSGIVINGQMVYGHDGFAGELGHTIIRRENGRLCGCGRHGCLETYCSATGVARTAREFLTARTEPSLLRSIPAENITSKDVYDAAVQGDKLAQDIFDFTGTILGEAIADFIAFSSPEAIILFGGLAKSGDYIFKPIQKAIDDNILMIYKGKAKLMMSELHGTVHRQVAALGMSSDVKGLMQPSGDHIYIFYTVFLPRYRIQECHIKVFLPPHNSLIRAAECQKHAVHQAVLLQEDHKARLLELAAPLELPPPSEREQQFQALWKQFYQTLEIKARHNEKCRMTHCPKRFWADMVEMKDEF